MEQGTCKLCGDYGDLRYSHIIPEAFYSQVYEKDEHQFFTFSNKSDKPKRRRKGLREPMLCPTCEALTMIYDDYAAKIWDGSDKNAQYLDKGNRLVISDIDYAKMKLFFIITLWRAGVSTLPDFNNIDLGVKHEATLRKMIKDNNPGRQYEYAVLLFASRKDPKVREILQYHISIFGACKIDGHTVYPFIIGRIMWYLFVSSHLKSTTIDQYCSLKETGELWVYQNDEQVEGLLRSVAKNIKYSVT